LQILICCFSILNTAIFKASLPNQKHPAKRRTITCLNQRVRK
jgi:hypothetical protein